MNKEATQGICRGLSRLGESTMNRHDLNQLQLDLINRMPAPDARTKMAVNSLRVAVSSDMPDHVRLDLLQGLMTNQTETLTTLLKTVSYQLAILKAKEIQ